MISDRLLDLMVGKLVFLTPSVSVSESRDRRVAQMFSTTFRSEYHNYSEFLQKESRERGLEHSARHATRAKPHLFVDPTQTSPFLSTRPEPSLLVDPSQTSPFCQPDPNLFCLSTRPEPLLFVNPTQTSSVSRPHPNLPFFVDPTQTSPFCWPESTFLRPSFLLWLLLDNWYLPPSAKFKICPENSFDSCYIGYKRTRWSVLFG